MGISAILSEVRGHLEASDVLDSEPSPEELEIIVNTIRQICHSSSLEIALRVGSLIVHHFYGGDVGAWRLRGPKTNSFRKLANHPKLPMSAGALCRCVAIFELCERTNAPSRWRNLGATHMRVVLGLKHDAQVKLLAEANASRWSVERLQREARQRGNESPRRGGRLPRSAWVKSLKKLQASLELQRRVLAEEPLAPGDLRECLELAEEVRANVEAIIREVNERSGAA